MKYNLFLACFGQISIKIWFKNESLAFSPCASGSIGSASELRDSIFESIRDPKDITSSFHRYISSCDSSELSFLVLTLRRKFTCKYLYNNVNYTHILKTGISIVSFGLQQRTLCRGMEYIKE